MTISVAQAQQFFLAFTRVMAMLIHVPMLGGRAIPNQVKIGLGFLLTAILLPGQPLPPEAALAHGAVPAAVMGVAIGRELVVGTLAGFAAALTFGALQMTGELMGLGGGFGAGRILNPTFDSAGSAMDQFFVMTAMLLFLIFNGHYLFIIAMARTFTAIPLNSPLPGLTAERLLRLTGQLIAAGALLATPVLGASLLADLTLGLLARVSPQVQVFFLGAPLKVAASLLAFMLALGVLFPALADLLRAIGPRMLMLLGG
ncbi:MAG: flagellar biosynthetic protein FliR [Chloroflexi bacterium]|nr:flagellar biosynthetic protein FliR [Chloroflexota bacterium]